MEKPALKIADKQDAIRKITRKHTRPVEQPFLQEIGADGFWRVFKAFAAVILIVPVIILGIVEGISSGFLAGMKTIVKSYEQYLED